MDLLPWLFDGILGFILLWLGSKALFAKILYEGIMAFIALGFFMAIAWLRLGAVDLALAEAILGGGVTGVLLLVALKREESRRHAAEK